MGLSNTAVPRYYGAFRDAVMRGEVPICKEIALEMERIDELIDNPRYYYDDMAVEGWVAFCEEELTLTDGSDLHLLDSFKLPVRPRTISALTFWNRLSWERFEG